uniref:HMG box domain-containing protein n=1 Tax=Glossina brevipalpis TaxID=37001 RepID=A0A1A9WDW0_9MUSC
MLYAKTQYFTQLNPPKMAGERPKRPLSAYMLWLNENREQIKKDNPGSKVTDIAKRGDHPI